MQGVGLRPTIWRLARDHGLRGWVGNDGAGVTALLCGSSSDISALLDTLQREPPLLARIDGIERHPAAAPPDCHDFRIVDSQASAIHTGVVPDAATCPACRAEIFDPQARRHGYPFANCTHCGPRMTIIEAIPYDRSNTTMRDFRMCPACAAEYRDPTDRRFHAQPIACATCGPRVRLEPAPSSSDPVEAARALLLAGGIVAVKALGGFHLACDATDAAAVARLRQAKRRDAKPFALMARDVTVIRRYAVVTEADAAALQSPAAPIVVLQPVPANLACQAPAPPPPRASSPAAPTDAPSSAPAPWPAAAQSPATTPSPAAALADVAPTDVALAVVALAGIAPGLASLGFMLPSTPLHHLLLRDVDRPLVMTSGNLTDEPQCTGNDEARTRLRGIADHILLHNRDIARRIDDSVVRVMGGAVRVLRRARGYAPAPLPLPPGFTSAPPLLAMGGEQKNTFALLHDGAAVMSHHIGDLENAPTFLDYRRSIEQYSALFAHTPSAVAVDRHPDYLSTKHGRAFAAQHDLPVIAVQHHHAHLAACLAENGVPLDAEPVLGIVLDGLGWGDDGTLWGGEFLRGDYRGFQRLACFKPVAMPGGIQAIREPWRNAYAHIAAALGWPRFTARYGQTDLAGYLATKPLGALDGMIARRVNAPLASSCGRLFDAVAAATGLCRERAAYEGHAAMLLDAAADSVAAEDDVAAGDDGAAYPFAIVEASAPGLLHLDPAPMWQALLRDIADHAPVPLIAWRFHVGLAIALTRMVAALAVRDDVIRRVALSGGVFQNKLLLEQVMRRLLALGLDVLTHRSVPANDGGLALGQAAVAAARMLAGDATGD